MKVTASAALALLVLFSSQTFVSKPLVQRSKIILIR